MMLEFQNLNIDENIYISYKTKNYFASKNLSSLILTHILCFLPKISLQHRF